MGRYAAGDVRQDVMVSMGACCVCMKFHQLLAEALCVVQEAFRRKARDGIGGSPYDGMSGSVTTVSRMGSGIGRWLEETALSSGPAVGHVRC